MKEITYEKRGEYLYPNLALPETKQHTIGKYGLLRRKHIKTHHRGFYTTLLSENKLNDYLRKVDEEASVQVEAMIEQYKKSNGITEQMKSESPLKLVAEMNAAKIAAEEFVLREVIYETLF